MNGLGLHSSNGLDELWVSDALQLRFVEFSLRNHDMHPQHYGPGMVTGEAQIRLTPQDVDRLIAWRHVQ